MDRRIAAAAVVVVRIEIKVGIRFEISDKEKTGKSGGEEDENKSERTHFD